MIGTANRGGIHMIGFIHEGVVFKQLPDHHLSLHNLLTFRDKQTANVDFGYQRVNVYGAS